MKTKGRIGCEKFDSKIRTIWYDPDEAFEFISVPYQRAVSTTHVNKLLRSLQQQQNRKEFPHFNEPFVVNDRGDSRVTLLDGYHRWEAMKKFGDKVKIKLEIYAGLTEEQEKKIYEDYNIGKKHTVLDLIRPHIKSKMQFGYLMEESSIPLTVYNNKKQGITMSGFIDAYRKSLTDSRIKKLPLAEYIMTAFNIDDAKRLVKFADWYHKIIGAYSPGSLFYNRNFLAVLMHTFWNTMKLDLLERRLEKFTFDSELREVLLSTGGFAGFKSSFSVFQTKINKGLTNKII
tara:strand:- start:1812 stop:2675 length:864 start_codon:yes stop_codon:yes gene_type:complete